MPDTMHCSYLHFRLLGISLYEPQHDVTNLIFVYLTDHGLSMPVCVSTKFHLYDPHT